MTKAQVLAVLLFAHALNIGGHVVQLARGRIARERVLAMLATEVGMVVFTVMLYFA